eukprot:3915270-Lingulodinium_polyedra.AAC.1
MTCSGARRAKGTGISDLDSRPKNGNLAHRTAGAARPNCKSESEETQLPTRICIRSGSSRGLDSEWTR